MKNSVIINEVGPRDGLQNQSRILSCEQRLMLIRELESAGLTHIEVGAFVSPKVVPAMAGTDQLLGALNGEQGEFSVLVPNLKGYELAVSAGAKVVTMVLYATDGMARANVNMSLDEVKSLFRDITDRALEDGVKVIATIAVSFECPFDGPVAQETVIEIAANLFEHGAAEVMVADTIGAAHPGQARSLTQELVKQHGTEKIGCHFHDTRAMGLANVFAAIESGVRKFDTSVGGLGGCPFAPGASGNVATEDVVMMLEQMGFDTGINQLKLAAASKMAADLTGNAPGGRARAWLNRHLGISDPGHKIN